MIESRLMRTEGQLGIKFKMLRRRQQMTGEMRLLRRGEKLRRFKRRKMLALMFTRLKKLL